MYHFNPVSGVQGCGTWTHSIGGQAWKSFLPSPAPGYPSCQSATGAGHRSVATVPVMTQDGQQYVSTISSYRSEETFRCI